jgi:hypothetical protein
VSKKKVQSFSVNSLHLATGMDRGTIQRRLKGIDPDCDSEFSLRLILQAFESHGAGISEKLDAQQETAKLRKAQRERIEREEDLAKGITLLAGEVEEFWASKLVGIQSKVMIVPGVIAEDIAAESNPDECEKMLESKLSSALKEASDDSE